ncbi:MAG: hypothetical protein GTN39_00555 [Candidatus Aenigmarchaeota archaeon]|nr:hypothetical protein [Candidatus Aenigmarchaeota archaeon]
MRVWIFILAFLILVFTSNPAGAQSCSYTGAGDWVINATDVCADEVVNLNGNLLVESSGNLTLDNVTLMVNSTSDGSLRIENNGSLQAVNSGINSSSGFSYLFITNSGADLLLRDSGVSGVGFSSTDRWRNGLYIGSDNSEISGSTITGNYMGVVLEDIAGCTIRDSVFDTNQLYDLYLLSSENVAITNTNYTTLVRNWYLNVKVVDNQSYGVEGAYVVITDVYGSGIYSGNSLLDGSVPAQSVREILENKAGIDIVYNPYTINASKSGYYGNESSVNVTGDVSFEIVIEPENVTSNVTNISTLVITVRSPPNGSVYYKPDLVNGSFIKLEVETNINVSSCDYMLDSIVAGSLSETSPENFRAYHDVSDFTEGEYVATFLCGIDATENTTQTTFFVYPERECTSDLDCDYDEKCASDFTCEVLSCGCGYPSNHQCVSYECCEDDVCQTDEVCDLSDHTCEEVQCECGVARNHKCVFPYPDYCCTKAHCRVNQTCDVIDHRCVTQVLQVQAPESVLYGEWVRVYVGDQDNNSVSGASVIVTYSDSGNIYIFSTNVHGIADVLINESGNVQISARKADYFAGFTLVDVAPTFDWVLFSVIFGVIFVVILLPILLKKGDLLRLARFGGLGRPLKLEKTTSGKVAMLRIKNKTSENLKLLTVVDTVPSGAFIRCNLMPEIETIDRTTDRLKWTVLELKPKEEIDIEYEASGFYKGFAVEFGGKRYEG